MEMIYLILGMSFERSALKVVLLGILVFFSSKSFAILEFEDAAFPELVTSARALAMGNSYMNKVDDAWSAFYNPAGLGTVRGFQFHLTNIHLETNNGFLDITAGEGSYGDAVTNYQDAFSADGLRTLMANNPGELSHARFQMFPNITFRGLTIGYMYSQQNRGRLQTLESDFEIAERIDSGPVFALNLSLWGGVLKFGAAAVLLTRQEFQRDYGPTETISVDKETDYTGGTMTHITAGMRLTLPIFMIPTFSAVIRNSSDSEFSGEFNSGLPTAIPQTTDVGFSLTPFTGKNARWHLDFTARDVGNAYDTVSSRRKFAFGTEFDLARMFFVRAGFGDGWGSGGVGVRNNEFIFDLTTYAVEVSTDPDAIREKEDRRYALSISYGF